MRYTIESVKKTRNPQEPITNIFYDYLGILSTWFLGNFTKITPNQVSSFGVLLGIISAYFFVKGELLIGGVVYVGRILTDNIDGRLARITNQKSKWGAWYENYTGIFTLFINIIAVCYGQYVITGKIVWLILAPLLLHSFRLHNWESMKMNILLGDKFRGEVVQSKKGDKEQRGILNRLKAFLEKNRIQIPFNSSDGAVLILILGPITGLLFEAMIFWLIAILLMAVFWFFYYRSILKKEDEEARTINKKKHNS